MSTASFAQQQTLRRLATIREKAESMAKYAQRAEALVGRGLASDMEGLTVCEVMAQYMELVAMQASLSRAHADQLAKDLRALRQ